MNEEIIHNPWAKPISVRSPETVGLIVDLEDPISDYQKPLSSKMQTVVEFNTVTGNSDNDNNLNQFNKEINSLLKKGWELHGLLICLNNNCFIQALIRNK